jgi:aspartate/methionine/tyrosine aminotransferase
MFLEESAMPTGAQIAQVATTEENSLPPLAGGALRIPSEGAVETLSLALELEARGVDIVHLEIGQPDFPTPSHVVEAGLASIRAGRTRYGPAKGTPELRAAIADHIAETRHIGVDPAHVLVGPGGKPIIFFTILALVEPGEEVIVPDPGFPTYAGTVEFIGGVPVSLPLRAENDFRIDVDLLRSLVTDRTKLLILNSPANPTGSVLSQAELEAIADIAQSHNLWVLSDEIYCQLYYGETPPVSIASLPGMAERTVLLDGFSKAYSMTGWRLGYGVFPKPLVEPITNLFINAFTCVSLFVQDAGVAALQGPQEAVAAMRAEYLARRDLVVEALDAIPGFACPVPTGAFYVMPEITGLGVTDTRAFAKMLLEAGVAVLPGADFGSHGEGYLRISYGTAREKLVEGLNRIRAASERWQQNQT